jgi:hypothetical protein
MVTSPEAPKQDLPAAALEAAKATASNLASKENVANMVDGAAKNAPLVGNVIGMVPPEQRKGLINSVLDAASSFFKPIGDFIVSFLPPQIKTALGMGGGDTPVASAPAKAEETSKPAPSPTSNGVTPDPTPKVASSKSETKTLG